MRCCKERRRLRPLIEYSRMAYRFRNTAVIGRTKNVNAHIKKVLGMQIANKVLQMTQTALGSFGISLSHNGLVPVYGSLPVVRARFGRLSTGVSALPDNN